MTTDEEMSLVASVAKTFDSINETMATVQSALLEMAELATLHLEEQELHRVATVEMARHVARIADALEGYASGDVP